MQVGHRRVHRRPGGHDRDHHGLPEAVAGQRVEEQLEQPGVGALVRRRRDHQHVGVADRDLDGGVAAVVGQLDDVAGRAGRTERVAHERDDVLGHARRTRGGGGVADQAQHLQGLGRGGGRGGAHRLSLVRRRVHNV